MLHDYITDTLTKGARAYDYDGVELIAKCGEVKVHHWARKTADPDTWWEKETPWHINWKSLFPENDREQKITDCTGETHRMDARTFIGIKAYVLEFQNSRIEISEVSARDTAYKNNGYAGVIWVWNGETIKMETEALGNGLVRAVIRTKGKAIWQCDCLALIDCGETIYQVVATPEYENDYWYLKPMAKGDVIATLTTNASNTSTMTMRMMLEEGAA